MKIPARSISFVLPVTLLVAMFSFSWRASGDTDVVVKRTQDIRMAKEALNHEALSFGGWTSWYESLKPIHERWSRFLATAPDLGKGVIAGSDNFLFLKTWETYVLEPSYIHGTTAPGSDVGNAALNTLVDLNAQLMAHGIHFIVVPVPARSEIYPEKLLPSPAPSIPVAPHRKEFVAALLERNVEAIDLLPALTEAKYSSPVSLTNDTHWTSFGASVAAREISKRLRRYDWDRLYGAPSSAMHTVDTTYDRSWSLYERLTPENQKHYPAAPVSINQVRMTDDRPYAPDPAAPLLVTGDSFLFFYAPAQADVASHLAAQIGHPVATIPMGGGQAARVARNFARMSPQELSQYKVVIFVFLAPYLRYDNWKSAPLPDVK